MYFPDAELEGIRSEPYSWLEQGAREHRSPVSYVAFGRCGFPLAHVEHALGEISLALNRHCMLTN